MSVSACLSNVAPRRMLMQRDTGLVAAPHLSQRTATGPAVHCHVLAYTCLTRTLCRADKTCVAKIATLPKYGNSGSLVPSIKRALLVRICCLTAASENRWDSLSPCIASHYIMPKADLLTYFIALRHNNASCSVHILQAPPLRHQNTCSWPCCVAHWPVHNMFTIAR